LWAGGAAIGAVAAKLRRTSEDGDVANVLVVEDEPVLADTICAALRMSGLEATSAATGEEGIEVAAEIGPDVILLDLRLPGIDGLEVMRRLQEQGTLSSIVIMTAHGDVRTAVGAMKGGASDFLTKPLDLDELQLVIDRVVAHRRMAAQLDYFRDRERVRAATDEIIGTSSAMMQVKRLIERLVSTPALASELPPSVLITGETGTGKDLVARAIHYSGARRDGPFIHVNCTALPDNLVESELFGYVKGAFTDARRDKQGLLQSADHGTVFLDEIGHMPLGLQAKLLSALEHRRIRPVGGTRDRTVDIHVIAATNRVLEEAIREGEFREDLYHRLRVVRINMPPLRQRDDDIVALSAHFLRLYSSRFGLAVERFAPEAIELMHRYDWPGNVRELSHTIESALLVCSGSVIRPEHLSILPPAESGGVQVELPGMKSITLDFAAGNLKLEDVENFVIQSALEHARHNVSRAARILGVTRDTIRYRMAKYARRQD
jgi:DNA-binding NtrC family response regulator